MTLWCMILVTIVDTDGSLYKAETAAHGVVVSHIDMAYRVDFTKYATQHDYQGPESDSILTVNRDKCVEGD